MDMSKLPRLSNTQSGSQDAEAAPADNPSDAHKRCIPTFTAAGRGQSAARRIQHADVWISIAVRAILLLMYPRFLQWVSSRVFGCRVGWIMPEGKTYTQMPEFWGDLGPTLFGLVLLVEGIALAMARKRFMLMIAFALTTAVATGYNLGYLVLSYSTYGLALVSALAVAFGVYILMYQWKMLQEWRRM